MKHPRLCGLTAAASLALLFAACNGSALGDGTTGTCGDGAGGALAGNTVGGETVNLDCLALCAVDTFDCSDGMEKATLTLSPSTCTRWGCSWWLSIAGEVPIQLMMSCDASNPIMCESGTCSWLDWVARPGNTTMATVSFGDSHGSWLCSASP